MTLSGCANASDAPLKDGTYSVTFDEPDPTDWKAFMTMEVKDQKIISVNYDYEGTGANEGKIKSEDAAYNEAMFSIKGTKPLIYLPELEEALLEHQDPDKVDIVSGATTSSTDFRSFVKAALEASRKGNQKTVILPQIN